LIDKIPQLLDDEKSSNIVEDAKILEAMADNEITVDMPPKRRYPINLKVQSKRKRRT
jgi:hypothetical protein